MTLQTRIERIMTLDGKRTAGEWGVYHTKEAKNGVLETLNGASYAYDDDDAYTAVHYGENIICDNAQFYPYPVEEHNQSFIAAAPSMVQIIREQAELLKEAREALDWLLKRIPEPECVGMDEAGHPEYSNDVDHSNAWERHVITKALQKLNEGSV